MVNRAPFAEKEFYHIYNRGVEKRIIFQDNSDYWRFLKLLYICNSTDGIKLNNWKNPFQKEHGKQLVAIGTYCLMSNHFHLLLTPLQEDGVSKFMQKLMTGYTMYFNKKYDRTGALFQGRYKSEHADNDCYLKYLFSYIHLNPVHTKKNRTNTSKNILKKLHTFQFSSHLDYLYPDKHREQAVILNTKYFPLYFNSQKGYLKELQDWTRCEDSSEVQPRWLEV